MSKINLSIEAASTVELQAILAQFVTNPGLKNTEVKAASAAEKKQKKKSAVKKEEVASTESISETEPSETGKVAEPTENVKEEVSRTANLYPDATKADVQKAMKAAMEAGKREEIKTAFGRFNATKLSDLKVEHYGVFLTDLKTLVGE